MLKSSSNINTANEVHEKTLSNTDLTSFSISVIYKETNYLGV